MNEKDVYVRRFVRSDDKKTVEVHETTVARAAHLSRRYHCKGCGVVWFAGNGEHPPPCIHIIMLEQQKWQSAGDARVDPCDKCGEHTLDLLGGLCSLCAQEE